MKINYEFMISEKFNIRKVIDILVFFLAMMLPCILLGIHQTAPTVTKENLSKSENIVGNTALITDWIPEIDTNSVPEVRLFTMNSRLNQMILLPGISKTPRQQTNEFPNTAVQKTADTSAIPAIIPEKPTNILPQQTDIPENSVTILPEQTGIPEDPVTILPEQTGIPENPATILPEQTDIPENPVILPDETVSVPDTVPEPSPEEISNQDFVCNGFICDASGKIIGCQDDMIVTDGVLCLPFNPACTGLGADALTPLSMEIYEIYIPANIVIIEEGAFDGLTELFFIEVHPDNPVYGSDCGCLYEK